MEDKMSEDYSNCKVAAYDAYKNAWEKADWGPDKDIDGQDTKSMKQAAESWKAAENHCIDLLQDPQPTNMQAAQHSFYALIENFRTDVKSGMLLKKFNSTGTDRSNEVIDPLHDSTRLIEERTFLLSNVLTWGGNDPDIVVPTPEAFEAVGAELLRAASELGEEEVRDGAISALQKDQGQAVLAIMVQNANMQYALSYNE